MPQNPKLTDQVYQFIRLYVRDHGFSPSQREIGAACHISAGTVRLCLEWLEAQGRIRRKSGTARTIVVIDDDR